MSSLSEQDIHGGLAGDSLKRNSNNETTTEMKTMFSNLDEQIETTTGGPPKSGVRLFRYAIVTVLSLIVFSGLLWGIWFLEY